MVQKISDSTTTANPSNEFTEGDPATSTPRTTLTAQFMNMVQREFLALIGAVNITPNVNDDDQLLEAIRALTAGGRRNKLDNAGFDLWQRNNTGLVDGTGTGYYCADRWFADKGDTGASPIFFRSGFVFGQTAVPGFPEYFAAWNPVGGTTSTRSYIEQRIENVRTLNGQTVTLSWYMSTNSGTVTGVTPKLVQHFGTGGSADVVQTGTDVNLSTTWVRFQQTFVLPTIAGKTFGDANNWLAVRFEWPNGMTSIPQVYGVQLELGDKATAFEQRTLAEEYMACARYYQKSLRYDLQVGGSHLNEEGCAMAYGQNAGDLAQMVTRLVTPMYPFSTGVAGPPTVTWWNVDGTKDEVEWNGARTVTANVNPGDAATGYPTVSTTPASNQVAKAHWTAEAEV